MRTERKFIFFKLAKCLLLLENKTDWGIQFVFYFGWLFICYVTAKIWNPWKKLQPSFVRLQPFRLRPKCETVIQRRLQTYFAQISQRANDQKLERVVWNDECRMPACYAGKKHLNFFIGTEFKLTFCKAAYAPDVWPRLAKRFSGFWWCISSMANALRLYSFIQNSKQAWKKLRNPLFRQNQKRLRPYLRLHISIAQQL